MVQRDDVGGIRDASRGCERGGPGDARIGGAHGGERAIRDAEVGIGEASDGLAEGESDQGGLADAQGGVRDHDADGGPGGVDGVEAAVAGADACVAHGIGEAGVVEGELVGRGGDGGVRCEDGSPGDATIAAARRGQSAVGHGHIRRSEARDGLGEGEGHGGGVADLQCRIADGDGASQGGSGDISGDGGVRAGGGCIGSAACGESDGGRDGSDDGAGAGHATDGHIVSGRAACDDAGGGSCGAGEGHIGGVIEVRDCLAEDDGVVDADGIGRIGLSGSLIDRDGESVVIVDRARGRCAGDDVAIVWGSESHDEGFIQLCRGIAAHGDGHGGDGIAIGDGGGAGGQGAADEVGAVHSRAADGVGHGYTAGGIAGAGDGEDEVRGAGVAFADGGKVADGDGFLQLKGSDVDGADGADEAWATLVHVDDFGGVEIAIDVEGVGGDLSDQAGIERGACGEQGVGLGAAAVVGEGGELWVDRRGSGADLVAISAIDEASGGARVANEVAAAGGKGGADYIRERRVVHVAGDDAIGDIDANIGSHAAGTTHAAVVGDGAVAQRGGGGTRPEAACIVKVAGGDAIPGDGRVDERDAESFVVDTAATSAPRGGVAGDGGVDDGEIGTAKHAVDARAYAAALVVADGAADDGKGGTGAAVYMETTAWSGDVAAGQGQAAKLDRFAADYVWQAQNSAGAGSGGGVLQDEQVGPGSGDGEARLEADLTAAERDRIGGGIREVHRATGAVGEGDGVRARDAVGIINGLAQRAGATVRRGGDEEAVLGDGDCGVRRASGDVAAACDDIEAGRLSGFGGIGGLGEGGEGDGGGELAVRDDDGACAGAGVEGEGAAGGQIEVRGRRGGAASIELEADGEVSAAGSTGEGVETSGSAFHRRGGGGGDADGIDDAAGELRGGAVVVSSGILSGATGHIGRDGDARAARGEVEGIGGAGACEVGLRAASDGDVGEVETGDGFIEGHGDGDDGIRGRIARGAADGDGGAGVIDGVGFIGGRFGAGEGVASGVSDVITCGEIDAHSAVQAGKVAASDGDVKGAGASDAADGGGGAADGEVGCVQAGDGLAEGGAEDEGVRIRVLSRRCLPRDAGEDRSDLVDDVNLAGEGLVRDVVTEAAAVIDHVEAEGASARAGSEGDVPSRGRRAAEFCRFGDGDDAAEATIHGGEVC